jgi:hypothetical protein
MVFEFIEGLEFRAHGFFEPLVKEGANGGEFFGCH